MKHFFCSKPIKYRKQILSQSLPYTFPLIIHEILFFLMLPYHKFIFTINSTLNGENRVGFIIIRLLYYFVYILTVYELLNGTKEKAGSRKRFLILTCKLLALCLFEDVISLIAVNHLPVVWQYFVDLLLQICFVMITVDVISKKSKNSCFGLNQLKNVSLYLLCILPVYCFTYLRFIQNREKYSLNGCVFPTYYNNLVFKLQLYNLIFTILWTALYFNWVYSGKDVFSIRKGENKPDKSTSNNYIKHRQKNINLIRYISGLLALVIIAVAKMVVYPFGSLIVIPQILSQSCLTEEYGITEREIVFNRLNNSITDSQRNRSKVFQIKYVSIESDRKKIVSFVTTPTDASITPRWLDKQVTEVIINSENTLDNNNCGVTIACIYSSDIIFYFDENNVKVIPLRKICSESENVVLTEVLEKCIKNGFWDYFEYGAKYLLKYDPDFIEPYIIRYSDNSFTDKELKQSSYINREYAVDYAGNIKSQI